MAPLNLKGRAGCTVGACMEFSRSGELGGAACCLSGVAGVMGGRLGLVCGPGGGVWLVKLKRFPVARL